MYRSRLIALAACLLATSAAAARAQPAAPFVLVAERGGSERDSTTRSEAVTVFYGKALVPTTGIAVTRGALTFVGASDVPAGGRLQPLARSAEVAWQLTGADLPVRITAASGLRHEREGQDVLVGRLTAGYALNASRLVANVTLEKAFGQGRDAVDLVTALGWTHPVTHRVHLGAEAIGEDLEGLWDAHEADGGARLFVGPTAAVAAAHQRIVGRVTVGADLRGPGIGASTTSSMRSGFGLRATLSVRY